MRHDTATPSRGHLGSAGRRPAAARRALATGVASALVLSGAAFGALPAHAGPNDRSTASARYLSGSLLDLIDLDEVAAIGGTSASNTGQAERQIDRDPLDLSVLGETVTVTLPSGLQLPVRVADAGLVGHYSHADDDGSSFGASGLVNDSGAVGAGPVAEAPPGPLTFDLADLLGDEFAGTVSGLELSVGATTATAESVQAGDPVGDYAIAGVDLLIDSPLVADLAALVRDAAAPIDTALAASVGDGGAVGALLDELQAALPLVTVGADPVTLESDVEGAVAAYLEQNALLELDGVVLDLGAGTIAVDLDALLASERLGTDLNDLDESTELLSEEVLTALVDIVDDLVGDLVTGVGPVIDTALRAARLTVGADVDVDLGLLGTVDLLDIDLSGTLAEIAGDPGVDPVITLAGTDVLASLGLGGLLGDATGAVDELVGALIDDGGVVDGLVGDVAAALDAAVLEPLGDLDAALLSLFEQVLSLTVNVQETGSDGDVSALAVSDRLTQTALRLALLEGSGLELDIAQASVGPNVDFLEAAVDTLTPTEGPETGGTEVTISGTDLESASAVDFGGAPATILEATAEGLVVRTSTHAPGLVDVTITTDAGPVVLGDAFTYLVAEPAPVLLAVDPDEGPTTGGTMVTITGEDLVDVTEVTFGGNPAVIVESSDGSITVTTPPGAVGAVDVTVTTPDGTDVLEDGFTYTAVVAPPAVTALDPDEGPETGGTEVTITGSGLAGATEVAFDGVPATIRSITGTEIVVVTPAGAPGPVDVTVTAPNGTTTIEDGFTYTAVPDDETVVTEVDPGTGPESGGAEVTIFGSCFTTATAVLFGDVPAADFQVVDDNRIIATVPAGVGVVDVTVVTAECGPGTLPGGFEYVPDDEFPAISSVDPESGPETGGTTVTITGTGFDGLEQVRFGTGVATVVEASPTAIVATTPAGPVGPVDVTVVTGNGTTTFADGFEYLAAPPVIGSVDPSSGPVGGGTTVTIVGDNLDGATEVTFGGDPAVIVESSEGSLVVTTPPGTVGPVDVVVTTPRGTDTLENGYEYLAPVAPVVVALAPTTGPESGGTTVTITGSGFDGLSAVRFGDGVATIVSATGSELVVTTPPGPRGPVDVTIVTATGETVLVDAFTYTPVSGTDVDGVAPGTGPQAGGTTVTITGTCFTGATAVRFGQTPATGFSVVSDTEIRAVSPAGAGTVDVTVDGADGCGTASLEDGFRYVDGGGLASTGAESGTAAGTALLLLLLGGLLLVLRRRGQGEVRRTA